LPASLRSGRAPTPWTRVNAPEGTHLHPARVRGVDEGAQVLVGPEVRVDLREVGDPAAVVARGREPRVVLDGLVLEARRQPDGRRAEVWM